MLAKVRWVTGFILDQHPQLGKIILIPTIVLSLAQTPVRLQVVYSCCASLPSAKQIK